MKELNLKGKYHWVDAMRGYAISLVILIHSSQTFYISSFLKKIADSGYLGVQLFFIMSSFTLYNSYSKRIDIGVSKLKTNFFIRRYFRIAPYYYCAGIIYLLYRVLIKNESPQIKNLISNFTFTNGIYLPSINSIPPGGWSVGIEMLFYTLIPVLFKYINSLKKAVLFFVLTLMFSILINQILIKTISKFINNLWSGLNEGIFYYWLPFQLPFFILGIVLYFINKEIIFSYRMGQFLLIGSIGLFLGINFLNFTVKFQDFIIRKEYIFGFIFVFFAIGTYTTNSKIIVNNLIRKIGLVSFSLYLNHFLILYIFGYLNGGFIKFLKIYLNMPEIVMKNDFIFLAFYFFVFYFSYKISQITYKYIEIPGIYLGNSIITKLNRV